MDQQPSLPRFKKPPVSEVAIGIQFQAPILTPVHLGLYYQMIKDRFPAVAVQPPLQPVFETFEPLSPPILPMTFSFQGGMVGLIPRMWFSSSNGSSLVQLQPGRLNFNWRGGLEGDAYPHFQAVQSEFANVLTDLDSLIESEGLENISVNQCELIYVNPLPSSVTGVSLSEPQKIFRLWGGSQGEEWTDAPEDVTFGARYRFCDEKGNPFGRLTVTLTSGVAGDGTPAFQLQMAARGRPIGEGRLGITAFHNYAHEAIVRCFAAITTSSRRKDRQAFNCTRSATDDTCSLNTRSQPAAVRSRFCASIPACWSIVLVLAYPTIMPAIGLPLCPVWPSHLYRNASEKYRLFLGQVGNWRFRLLGSLLPVSWQPLPYSDTAWPPVICARDGRRSSAGGNFPSRLRVVPRSRTPHVITGRPASAATCRHHWPAERIMIAAGRVYAGFVPSYKRAEGQMRAGETYPRYTCARV